MVSVSVAELFVLIALVNSRTDSNLTTNISLKLWKIMTKQEMTDQKRTVLDYIVIKSGTNIFSHLCQLTAVECDS